MIFEYACETCEVKFEEEFPIGKAPLKSKCPKCGQEVGRTWDSSFILVGSGWTGRDISLSEKMGRRRTKATEGMMKKGWSEKKTNQGKLLY